MTVQPEVSKYSSELLPLLFTCLSTSSQDTGQRPRDVVRVYYAMETFCENLGMCTPTSLLAYFCLLFLGDPLGCLSVPSHPVCDVTLVYCGQTVGWIKVPFGMEVGLGPCHIVLDGNPKGAQPPPIFGPCLLWPNSWMDQDATWYGGRPRPRRHCVR